MCLSLPGVEGQWTIGGTYAAGTGSSGTYADGAGPCGTYADGAGPLRKASIVGSLPWQGW